LFVAQDLALTGNGFLDLNNGVSCNGFPLPIITVACGPTETLTFGQGNGQKSINNLVAALELVIDSNAFRDLEYGGSCNTYSRLIGLAACGLSETPSCANAKAKN
jgi:hypothetical protein